MFIGRHTYLRKIVWSVIVLVIIGIGVFAVITYMDDEEQLSEAESQENGESNDTSNTGDEASSKISANENVDPFKQKYHQEELTDKIMRDFIHKMSHQKVKAEDKWGFFEMTEERINWLRESLEQEAIMSHLTDADVYLDILNRWHEGDFSEVDQDHNAIWRLQGGSIGKATGILSEEKEEHYIKNTSESK